MSKVWSILVMVMAMLILLELAGINTGGSGLISYSGMNVSITNSSEWSGGGIDYAGSGLWLAIAAIVVVAITGGIIATFTGANIAEWSIKGALASAVGIYFVSSFVSIIGYANTYLSPWVSYVTFVFMGLTGFAYLIALMEWVFGQ